MFITIDKKKSNDNVLKYIVDISEDIRLIGC